MSAAGHAHSEKSQLRPPAASEESAGLVAPLVMFGCGTWPGRCVEAMSGAKGEKGAVFGLAALAALAAVVGEEMCEEAWPGGGENVGAALV